MEGKKRQIMHQERDNLGLTIGLAIVGTILANILIRHRQRLMSRWKDQFSYNH